MRRLAALLPLALLACRSPAPLDAELVGCGARFADGRCALPADGALRVFVPGPADRALAARLDGAPVEARVEAVPGGALLRLTVPAARRADPGALQIDAPAAPARSVFALAPPEPPVPEGRAEVEAALSAADPTRRGPLLARLARLHLRAGEADAAEARFAEAEAAHRAVGRRSAILRDLEARVFTALYVAPRYAHARALLDRHAALADDRRSRGLGAYSRGLLAWQTGDPAAAAEAFEAARRALRPLGDVRETVVAAEMEAVVLRALGRGEAALARLDALRASLPADAACDRARLLLNTGWVATLERARRGAGPDPIAPLEAAHAAFAEGPCAQVAARRTAALNLALAALDAGDVPATRRWLATLPAAEDGGALARWRLDVEGRLALRAGDPAGAAARFERLARLAGELAPEAGWRAAVGLGDARLAAGDAAGALAAWRRAEALLDAEALRLPLDRDRARFVVDREASARRLVALLTRLGRPAEALCAARLARGRALAGAATRDRIARLDPAARHRWDEALGRWRAARARLEAASAADWTLDDAALAAARASRAADARAVRRALAEALAVLERAGERPTCADLRGPAPDEALLAWFPAELPDGIDGTDGINDYGDDSGDDSRNDSGDDSPPAIPPFVGFALTAAGVRAVPIAAAEPAALLAPFAAEIGAAHRLRLIAGGGLERLDLHAAPWPDPTGGEAPLGALRGVGWALDLPRRPARPIPPQPAPALVIGDPSADLPAAREEAEVAAGALGRAGWAVHALTGPAATGEAVRARLSTVELVHYAGHGEARRDDPFAARLPLAGGGRLGIGDLIALGQGPRWVVLTGCLTGYVDPSAAAGGLTLAHGFLLAGADGVLAATAVVDDGLAGAVGAHVAARLGPAPAADLVSATRDALAALGDRPGRAAFRVWVP